MEFALPLAILLLGALAIIGAVAWHWVDVLGARRLAKRHKVLVNLHSGKAFQGVLWARRGRLLVLKSAELLEPNAEPVALDGDVIVDRSQIEFLQAAT